MGYIQGTTPTVVLGRRTFADDMAEISGFGGSYEAACRAMVLAGVAHLEHNSATDPKFHGFRNITGIIVEDNDDAQSLSKAMMDATIDGENGTPRRIGDDCTGAMHEFSMRHVFRIRKVGWEQYCSESRALRKTEDREQTH